MRVLLAGAFGNLGYEILKSLLKSNHEIIAADLKERDTELKGKYTFIEIDATKPETLTGICNDVDVVITTMGLTGASTVVNSYDIDYQGNLNLLNEAKKANIKKFVYISVIACKEKGAEKVPMLHAKAMFEDELLKSGLEYVIHRPTGYFYDICKVFQKYVDKGEMQLLKGYHNVRANVIDCPDFAEYIVEHMNDTNAIFEVGGKETYTYEEMAKMCLEAAGKPVVIKDSPIWMFDILAMLPFIKKAGKSDIIKFSKWTLSHDLVGKDITGEGSFKEYVKEYYKN